MGTEGVTNRGNRRLRMVCMLMLYLSFSSHLTFQANKKIQSIANVLKLSEVVCLAATRMYTLAVEHKFTKGRKSMNVVAVCLYVACRQKETRNYMLIDFSDLLQVRFLFFSFLLIDLLDLFICFVYLGERVRTRTHLPPTRANAQPPTPTRRSIALYLPVRRAPRIRGRDAPCRHGRRTTCAAV